MKKIIGLILALCLVFTLAAEAFAAGKPVITKQPESATTSKKGSVSFSISVKGTVSSYTWYFVNPATGEKISGKNLPKSVKGVKVTSPNGKKISLSRVPDSMHGWTVFCHVNGNGYKVDSDSVMLLVYGLEPPQGTSDVTPASEPEPEPDPDPEPEPDSEPGAEPEGQAPADSSSDDGSGTDEAPAEPPENDFGELEGKTITVSTSSRVLYKLDGAGNIVEGEPASSLEFSNTASFAVRSEDPIASWTVNGIRFEPAEPITEIRILNATTDIALDINIERASAASAVVDENQMCHVTCKGCKFTCLSRQLRSVTEGEVPAGSFITVFADSDELAKKGYRVNGADPDFVGLASFRLTVTEDVEIIAE